MAASSQISSMWGYLTLKEDNVTILRSSSRCDKYLMTLEPFFIKEQQPKLNTKDEFISRTLTLQF